MYLLLLLLVCWLQACRVVVAVATGMQAAPTRDHSAAFSRDHHSSTTQHLSIQALRKPYADAAAMLESDNGCYACVLRVSPVW
jgi:hypothetical protein